MAMVTTRVDPHVKVLDAGVLARARRRGLDALVYAPHFTPWPDIVAAATAASSDDLLVVPGREVFTGPWHDRKHVLALDLDAPIPDFIPLEDTMAALDEQDACVLAPHPAYLTISLSPADLERYRGQLRAIERYNPKFLPWHGPRAERLAADLDRPTFASSYAHLRATVGAAWTDVEGAIESADDLVEAIRAGRIVDVGAVAGPARYRHALAEIGHIGYENSLSKARRVLGPGREPTHPDRPLYGGRFES